MASTFLRQFVYREIDKERVYQDRIHGGKEHDREHDLSDWIGFMQEYIDDARALCTAGEDKVAREELRKIIALGVACLEIHGCPPRQT